MDAAATSAARGLTAAEVADRVARGDANDVVARSSRSVRQIVRGNVFTFFNALIAVLFALILIFGDWRDGLFGAVVIANAGIGIVQELRAKATLDRLRVVAEAQQTVRRDGAVVEVPSARVVLDDVLVVGLGDRVVVDGEVLETQGLEVDESLLTGEADPVHKQVGDPVLSGSFVVAGDGAFRATKVGAHAYAAELAAEARTFTLVKSELRDGVNQILRIMTYVLVPVGALLIWSQFRSDASVAYAVSGAVAGVVTMIPEGLVLMTSIALAVGVVRLGSRQVLVQELPAIEGLARVDVICLDKTGTLTEAGMRLASVESLDPAVDVGDALTALVAADGDPNASVAAIAEQYPARPHDGWAVTGTMPFSSARKWSGATFEGNGSWVIGAPEVLLPAGTPAQDRADAYAAQGMRVLLLAQATRGLAEALDPADLRPAALVVIEQRIKAGAAETLRYFARQGVRVKVISGDSPVTVAAVVRSLGVEGAGAAGYDARELPEGREEVADVMEREVSFGRVNPRQKQAMVRALQSRGHTVAMTGDGVNDVLALKDADIGIAMASGSDATRAVAQLVLVDNQFEQLPGVVAEGRRIINNIERVAGLFLTKTVYATVLALLSGVLRLPFPFLPRHLTVITALTIGIPGFFLALAPNAELARPGFVARVLKFALPAGVVCAVGAFATYYGGRIDEEITDDQVRSIAAITLFGIAWWVVVLVARPLSGLRLVLVLSMIGCFVAVLAVPALSKFFAFELPNVLDVLLAIGVAAAGVLVLEVGQRSWLAFAGRERDGGPRTPVR